MMEMIGPKPRWEYRKIELLNELNREIEGEAAHKGWKLPRSYVLEMPDIDSGCDPMNVHGWIQNMLDLAEGNLASLSEEILNQKPDALSDLKDIAYRFGYSHARETADVQSAYHLLDDVLLNGMPCDDVNEITAQSSEKITWIEKQDMHSKYWHDSSVYRQLRNAVISGLLAKSPVVYVYHEDYQSVTQQGNPL